MKVLRLTTVFFSLGLVCISAFANDFGPNERQADENRIKLTGTVFMPDGSPASGATVDSTSSNGEPWSVARTNAVGEFQIRGVFGNGARLHARSADGNQQTTLMISAGAVRVASATPIKLTLAAAIKCEITVVAGGRPVEGARIAATGMAFIVQGISGADGKAQLRLPAPGPASRTGRLARGARCPRSGRSRCPPPSRENRAFADPSRAAPNPRH